MLPKLCTRCNKWLSCKSSLNRHNRKVHGTHVQPSVDKFDAHEQSGGMYGGNDVQYTSQTNFENVDKQVDANSQTDFDDDDRSKVVNDGSDSDSDDSRQHSDFSLRCCYCSYSK